MKCLVSINIKQQTFWQIKTGKGFGSISVNLTFPLSACCRSSYARWSASVWGSPRLMARPSWRSPCHTASTGLLEPSAAPTSTCQASSHTPSAASTPLRTPTAMSTSRSQLGTGDCTILTWALGTTCTTRGVSTPWEGSTPTWQGIPLATMVTVAWLSTIPTEDWPTLPCQQLPIKNSHDDILPMMDFLPITSKKYWHISIRYYRNLKKDLMSRNKTFVTYYRGTYTR